jgi:hypothetical protein
VRKEKSAEERRKKKEEGRDCFGARLVDDGGE